jgi:predicted Zn-dependent protease
MALIDRICRLSASGIVTVNLLLSASAVMAQSIETNRNLTGEIGLEAGISNGEEPERAVPDRTADEKPDAGLEADGVERHGDEYFQLLVEADRLHEQGRRAEAEHLYRKAKGSFTGVAFGNRPEPITDPALLPPAGQVYWREAEAGQASGLLTRMLVPLELLVQDYPEFFPATIRYAELLLEQERPSEALAVLERTVTLYPDQSELVRARINALVATEEWLDASIAARQFALFHPEHPDADAFLVLADEHHSTFRSRMRSRLTGNAIANVFTGALSFALTGGFFGPFSAIDTAVLLLRGESQVGSSAASAIQRQIDLVEDPEVVAYVNDMGQRLADVAGRDDFEYEFFVVQNPGLNAFALPGGKIFIYAGAIEQTQSEAELAGLIAHEIAHSALSHGFQLVTSSNVTASVFLPVPYAGGLATDLTVLGYSRDMERQADAFGTRLLAAAGYAADGLYNLMVTLDEQNQTPRGLAWLSTHPDTQERIRNIETLIEENGYNRYTYEGVARHRQIQTRISQLRHEEEEKSQEHGLNNLYSALLW